jgi:uncharacterized protein
MSGRTRLEPLSSGGPVPRASPLSAPFWEGCNHGEIRFQRCDRCGTAIFEPSSRCRSCGASTLTWTTSTGRGELYSWTIYWRPQTPAFAIPYGCAVAEMEEGFYLLAGIGDLFTDELAVGLALEARFVKVTPDVCLPYFAPAT